MPENPSWLTDLMHTSSPVTHPKVMGPGVDPLGPITFWDEWAGTREELRDSEATDPVTHPNKKDPELIPLFGF